MSDSHAQPRRARGIARAATPGDDARRALDALRRLVRALGATARAAQHHAGVSGAQLFVLRELAQAPGLSLGELAARTHTGQSTVSEVVARLVEAGLVDRRVDDADARRRLLRLTAAGRAVARAGSPTVQERLVEALGTLPAAERRALARGLERWVHACGLDAEPPTMFGEEGGA